MREPAVYIMASQRNGTLYVGVTANLNERVWPHREALLAGFTKRYGYKLLVWYERHERMEDAIGREKQVKGGSRARKLALIETMNPSWRDLYEDLAG
ncbi:GIY-YIG nuclease family protein [Bosea sp. FBZP-16]|uniref:GIY-YIG nuclease family protein n=1 Tax=Bosea sp. FBZP-16 TaxID=2065382 RepID=UPI000C3126E8|nr:GIY-YIG nuclease family protein [Bosea sp. FBZP-16]